MNIQFIANFWYSRIANNSFLLIPRLYQTYKVKIRTSQSDVKLYRAYEGALQNVMWFLVYGKSFILSYIQFAYLIYLLLSSIIEKKKGKGAKINKIK